MSSRYCGKEWAAFSSRLIGGAIRSRNVGLIQPVLLTPAAEVSPLPALMRPVQYGHESYPVVYGERGLAYLFTWPARPTALDYAFCVRLAGGNPTSKLCTATEHRWSTVMNGWCSIAGRSGGPARPTK